MVLLTKQLTSYYQASIVWRAVLCPYVLPRALYLTNCGEGQTRAGAPSLILFSFSQATGGKNWDSPNFATWKCLSYKSTQKTCIDR